MDHHYSTTPSRKGKHLTFEERVIIQTRLKDGLKPVFARVSCPKPAPVDCP